MNKYKNFRIKQEKKYCVYGLSANDNPEKIVYIGYTNNTIRRYIKHVNSPKKTKTKLSSWIKSMQNKNIPIKMIIIEEFDNIYDCLKSEINCIKLFKSFGANLKNSTSGGESYLRYECKNNIQNTTKLNNPNVNEEDVIRLFKKGYKVKEICQKLNMNQSFYYKIKNKYNLIYDEKRPKIVKDFITKEYLYNLYIVQNKTKKEISQITGIKERNIKKRLKDYNIKKLEGQFKQIMKNIADKNKTIKNDIGELIENDYFNNNIGLKQLTEKYNIKYSIISNFITKTKNEKNEKNLSICWT